MMFFGQSIASAGRIVLSSVVEIPVSSWNAIMFLSAGHNILHACALTRVTFPSETSGICRP